MIFGLKRVIQMDMDYILYIYQRNMNKGLPIIAVGLIFLTTYTNSVEFILKPNEPTCTILVSSFDPIKVEAIFPTIGSKQQGEEFQISVINEKTGTLQQTVRVEDGKTYRNNFALESNIVYSLCFKFITERTFQDHDRIFVGFTAQQHFEEKIGKIQIPKELANEQNLKIIYETATKMKELNTNTIQNQKKERQLEDKLVDLSLHKGKRIVTITFIECFVIVISGLYQILALRGFLIQKNLY